MAAEGERMKQIGLVGLGASGKTTLFDALTGAHERVGTYTGLSGPAHVASVLLADERLDFLTAMFKPKKVTPVQLEFVDTPGLAVGAHESKEGNARLLGTLREVNALVLVVRAFASQTVAHPLTTVDAARDVAEIETELVLADLEVAERRADKVRKSLVKQGVDKKALETELAVLDRCLAAFNAGHGADTVELTDAERKMVSSFAFLTRLPRVIVVNLDEEQLKPDSSWRRELVARKSVVGIDAEYEMEVLELDPAERKAFLADAGITEPALSRLVRTCFQRLDLITFYTGEGGTETRAWEIKRGMTVLEAAGQIHSDIARGFIRAEVAAFDDIHAAGSMKEVRAQGKLHLEGKEYVVQDGDVIYIRFAV